MMRWTGHIDAPACRSSSGVEVADAAWKASGADCPLAVWHPVAYPRRVVWHLAAYPRRAVWHLAAYPRRAVWHLAAGPRRAGGVRGDDRYEAV